MTTKQVILIGYDDAVGVKVLDTATGRIIRETKGTQFTDGIERLFQQGDHIWATDGDSSLSVYTNDLALLARRDVGYDATMFYGSGQYLHFEGDFLYFVSRRKYDGSADVEDQQHDNQAVLRKLNKLTLATVSEIILDAPELWDSVGSYSKIQTGNCFWGTGFVWLASESNVWVKIDISSGAVIDTWDTAPDGGIDSYDVKTRDGWELKGIFGMQSWDAASYSFKIANFETKTVMACGPYDIRAAVGASGLADVATYNFSDVVDFTRRDQSIVPDFVGGTVKFMSCWSESNPDTGAAQNQLYKMAEVTLTFGDTTVVVGSTALSNEGLKRHDWDAKGSKYESARWYDGIPYDNQVAVAPGVYFSINEKGGFAKVDFNAGTVTITGEEWMHGYSSDAPYVESVMAATFNVTTISDTLTDSVVSNVGRKVFVYDELLGEKVGESVTNGSGAYAFEKFTGRKYFQVAPSGDLTRNFKINAHV